MTRGGMNRPVLDDYLGTALPPDSRIPYRDTWSTPSDREYVLLDPDPLTIEEPEPTPRRLGCSVFVILLLVGVASWTGPAVGAAPRNASDSPAHSGAPTGEVVEGPGSLRPAVNVTEQAPAEGESRDGGVVAGIGDPTPEAERSTGRPVNPIPALSAVTRQGTWAYADPSYGPRYLATPERRGTRLQVCGPLDCLELVTNDVGPVLSLQRAGRIGDLSASTFQRICGELRFGLCPGSYTVLHRAIRLPETATEDQP